MITVGIPEWHKSGAQRLNDDGGFVLVLSEAALVIVIESVSCDPEKPITIACTSTTK